MRQLGPFGGVAVAALFAAMALLVWIVMRRRVERAQAGERLADERRDRFLAVAARELDAPLSTLRADLAALDPWSATPPRIAELTRELDGVRRLVTELARLPAPVDEAERIDVDLAELVREVIGGPPFSDRGPSVILRGAPALVLADRARLLTGVRVLSWVVRRDVPEGASLVMTTSADEDTAYLEIDSGGVGEVAESLERLPAVLYGLVTPSGAAGTSLALHVAEQVARAHGGRLSASARVGQGERFVLELPRAPLRH